MRFANPPGDECARCTRLAVRWWFWPESPYGDPGPWGIGYCLGHSPDVGRRQAAGPVYDGDELDVYEVLSG